MTKLYETVMQIVLKCEASTKAEAEQIFHKMSEDINQVCLFELPTGATLVKEVKQIKEI